MTHKIYVNGTLIYYTKYKIMCNIVFEYLKFTNSDMCVTMISDYTEEN